MKMLKSMTSLALAVIMSVIFGITSFAADLCTVYVKGTVDYDKAFECLEIVNSERSKNGLAPLVMDESLMQIAINRAFEANLYFSHQRPDGSATNYWENVATGYTTATQVMEGWMSSSGHRDNILNPNQTAIGIACVNGVWIQEFSNGYSQQASKPANCTIIKAVSCAASNMYMDNPYLYKPELSVGEKTELKAPKLYLFNQLCYGVDVSSYEIKTSDSSIATVDGLTLTVHKSGNFSVMYTLKGTSIYTSVEFSVEGSPEEEKPSEPKNISECIFTLSETAYTYSGKECKPIVTVKDGNKTLSSGTDFTVRYENNVDAGCAKVYVTGKGKYTGTDELFFDIYMRNILDGAELEYYECQADGSPKKPKLITNTAAVEGVDYTVTYSNNIDPGIGIAYIEATNINYYGWGELYFNINEPSSGVEDTAPPADSNTSSFEEEEPKCVVYSTGTVKIELEYDSIVIEESGKKYRPKVVSVKTLDGITIPSSEYTVEYSANFYAGTAKVKISSDSDRYYGWARTTFTIKPKNLADAKITLKQNVFEANCNPIIPEFTVDGFKPGDYGYTVENNTEPGTGILTIYASGRNLTGSKTIYFEIVEKDYDNSGDTESENASAKQDEEETTDIPVVKKTQTISVSKNAKLTYGKTLELFVSAKTAISYKSLDTSVAKINSKGIITATGAGKTKILVTATETDEYKEATAYVSVTVEKAAQKITVEDSFTKYVDSPSFNIGAKAKTKLSYKSANTNIAVASANGTVTIKGTGTVSIKITAAENQNYKPSTKTVLITVYENNNNNSNANDDSDIIEDTSKSYEGKSDAEVIIEPDKTPQTISVPKTAYSKTIDSKSFYLNAKAKTKLTYRTSNSKVAAVNSNGKITIKGIGKATITITAAETDSYEKAVKKVSITVKPAKPKIKTISGKNGRITIRWDKLDDNITGYQIAYKRLGSESYKCKTYKGLSLTKKTLKGFSDRTYYVKMRTYKVVDGKRIYSSWSTVKKINISF